VETAVKPVIVKNGIPLICGSVGESFSRPNSFTTAGPQGGIIAERGPEAVAAPPLETGRAPEETAAERLKRACASRKRLVIHARIIV
jgi:hypothetical protein